MIVYKVIIHKVLETLSTALAYRFSLLYPDLLKQVKEKYKPKRERWKCFYWLVCGKVTLFYFQLCRGILTEKKHLHKWSILYIKQLFFFFSLIIPANERKEKKEKNKFTAETAVMEKISQDPPGVSGLIF